MSKIIVRKYNVCNETYRDYKDFEIQTSMLFIDKLDYTSIATIFKEPSKIVIVIVDDTSEAQILYVDVEVNGVSITFYKAEKVQVFSNSKIRAILKNGDIVDD